MITYEYSLNKIQDTLRKAGGALKHLMTHVKSDEEKRVFAQQLEELFPRDPTVEYKEQTPLFACSLGPDTPKFHEDMKMPPEPIHISKFRFDAEASLRQEPDVVLSENLIERYYAEGFLTENECVLVKHHVMAGQHHNQKIDF